jgi:hypothetical protein
LSAIASSLKKLPPQARQAFLDEVRRKFGDANKNVSNPAATVREMEELRQRITAHPDYDGGSRIARPRETPRQAQPSVLDRLARLARRPVDMIQARRPEQQRIDDHNRKLEGMDRAFEGVSTSSLDDHYDQRTAGLKRAYATLKARVGDNRGKWTPDDLAQLDGIKQKLDRFFPLNALRESLNSPEWTPRDRTYYSRQIDTIQRIADPRERQQKIDDLREELERVKDLPAITTPPNPVSRDGAERRTRPSRPVADGTSKPEDLPPSDGTGGAEQPSKTPTGGDDGGTGGTAETGKFALPARTDGAGQPSNPPAWLQNIFPDQHWESLPDDEKLCC